MEKQKLRVLSQRSDVMPFVDEAIAEADLHKDALGFFPANAFREFAHRELLLIAIVGMPDGDRYAGHLLFDCRFPKAHVLQILTHRDFRNQRVARTLADTLKDWLTSLGFISVYARVREDLQESNEFWARQNFYVQSIRKGGATRNRKIHVRSFELETPQLFSTPGLSLSHPLGVAPNSSGETALYLLDLNVFFDLGQRRPRNSDVLALFRADRAGVLNLAMSSEFEQELKRTARSGQTDPMLSYARIFPVLPFVESEESTRVLNELVTLVFPNNAGWHGLNERQKSDLRHVATVIHHKLAGLITSDEALLAAAYQISGRYRIEVISPMAIGVARELSSSARNYDLPSEKTLRVHPADAPSLPFVRDLLCRVGVPMDELRQHWTDDAARNPSQSGLCIWDGKTLVGYIYCPPWKTQGSYHARLALDERLVESTSAAAILIQHFLGDRPAAQVSLFSLTLAPNQSKAREVAWTRGFREVEPGAALVKVTLNMVITDSNWVSCRNHLLEAADLDLPESAPAFESLDQQIPIKWSSGARIFLSLETLESLLSPALFCLKSRPAVITPIRRGFADSLLGSAPQFSLLPLSKAANHAERHYLSAKKTVKKFARGAIILFYESSKQRGISGVVAIARVQRAYTKSLATLDAADFDKSVLDRKTLDQIGVSKSKTVTIFDNLMVLPKPVPLKTLKKIGCGRPVDLISTTKLSDAQLRSIVSEGFSNA